MKKEKIEIFKVLRYICLSVILIFGLMTIVGTGGGGGGGDDDDGPTLPLAGEWSGTSEFGEIDLVVTPDSTGIESITINFIEFQCGSITSNGSITKPGSWAISNGQFTADLNLTPSGDRKMNIRGTFDDSGTYVSGTYEADYDGTKCPGTWNASPEVEVSENIDGYLQYRTLSDASNIYRGWLEFTKNGNPTNESEISDIKLHDSAGNPVSISSYSFYALSSFWGEWNDSTSSVEFSGPFHESGFSIMFPDETNLVAGNYTYEATTNQGNLLSVTKYFPGETTLPVVDVASMNYEWLTDGDLRLRWSIPVGNYDELRIVLMDQDWDDLLYVKLPADKDELIIPNEWIEQITDYKNPRFAIWQVQTRSYTTTVDHNNYARGYSDNVGIPWSGDGPTPPLAGEWSGTSGFGEIDLVVTPDSTGIESIVITFDDFRCGNIITNGSIRFTGSWAISNGQFTADLDWTGTIGDREMNIMGTFDDSGTYVSGTYEADYDGTICAGIWEASPE